MDAGFDASQHGLIAVHCRDVERAHLHLPRRRGAAHRRLRHRAARYLGPHDLSNSKIAYESTIVENGNWKLVWENNRECYHCAGNHPALTRTFPEDPKLFGVSGDKGASPVLDRHIERCELAGAPSAFHMDPSGTWRFVRMPLLGTAESYTMDGKAAVAKPNSSLPFKDAGALLLFNYPSTWDHFLADHSSSFGSRRSARPRPRSAPSGWCTRTRRRVSTTTSSG